MRGLPPLIEEPVSVPPTPHGPIRPFVSCEPTRAMGSSKKIESSVQRGKTPKLSTHPFCRSRRPTPSVPRSSRASHPSEGSPPTPGQHGAYVTAELDRRKDIFDTIESKPLTPEQRLPVVVEEYATLVLAGAGSGRLAPSPQRRPTSSRRACPRLPVGTAFHGMPVSNQIASKPRASAPCCRSASSWS